MRPYQTVPHKCKNISPCCATDTMVSTPDQWNGAVLLSISALECIAGIGKSQGNMLIFCVGLFVEFICAGLQSAALILLMRNGMYSKLEYAIAVATVVVHALLLLWAAVLVYYNVVNLLQGRKGKNQFGAMVAMTIVAAFILVGFSPIIIAKFLGKSSDMFRNPLNSYLLLVTVLSPFLFLFIVSITEKYQWINIAVETVYMIVCGVLMMAGRRDKDLEKDEDENKERVEDS